jgi:hypothetical protein
VRILNGKNVCYHGPDLKKSALIRSFLDHPKKTSGGGSPESSFWKKREIMSQRISIIVPIYNTEIYLKARRRRGPVKLKTDSPLFAPVRG